MDAVRDSFSGHSEQRLVKVKCLVDSHSTGRKKHPRSRPPVETAAVPASECSIFASPLNSKRAEGHTLVETRTNDRRLAVLKEARARYEAYAMYPQTYP